ncbi:MAG: hypothetical protein KGN34_00370 [Sphingomonadales bacterium]|nr:hypothetical protein [Sphingomonadales bacterium]
MAGLDIGRTFSRTGGLVGASLSSVGIFLVIVQVVSAAITAVLKGRLAASMTGLAANPRAGLLVFQSGWYWLMLLVSFAVGAVAMAGALTGMVRIGRGETVSVGDLFTAGAAKAVPMFALSLLWMVGLWLGFLMLLVPGLILLAMWAVAAPALALEEVGVIGAFGRSRALTKGSRWKILLVLLVVTLLVYGGGALAMGLFGLSFKEFGASSYATPTIGITVGTAVWGLILGFVVDALLASFYLELHDGTGGHLTDVFA